MVKGDDYANQVRRFERQMMEPWRFPWWVRLIIPLLVLDLVLFFVLMVLPA